jgi:TolB protein
VYASSRTPGRANDIFASDPASGREWRLTDAASGRGGLFPAWSPDGTRIAFISNMQRPDPSDLRCSIFTMDPDGANTRRVTDEVCGDQFPEWSPDGESIIFLSDRDGTDRLYRTRVDGSVVERIGDVERANGARWSPDGTQIAFHSRTAADVGSTELFVIAADGTQLRQVTSNEWFDSYPDWSPDGRSLLFSSQRGGVWELHTIDLVDGSQRQVARTTTGPGGSWLGVWSPDGSRVAFTSGRSGTDRAWSDRSWRHLEIYVANADGTNVERITHNDFADLHPTW